jgi:hypothetical protein
MPMTFESSVKTLVVLSLVTACYGGGRAVENDHGTGTTSTEDDAASSEVSSAGAGTTTDAADDDSGGSSSGDATDTGGTDEPSSDPLDGLPTGEDQWELLCARGHDDPIARAFCAGDAPPEVTSITELLELVGLGFVEGNLENGENGNPGLTLASHSTAIGTRFVNAINPRAFVFTPPVGGVTFPPSGTPNPDLAMMAFARGEHFVELVANDRTDDELRFYLFRFVPACEDDDDGCDNADLFTPAAESGFVGYSLYDDYDIRNTVLDCLQCHQPDGPGTAKVLRMQELVEGWTHWYYPNRVQNREAMQMFVDAHEGESYGGIPGAMLTGPMLLENNEGTAAPIGLEQVIRNQGFAQQPNEFLSQQIITERLNAGCICNNCMVPPPIAPTESCSPTWDALYASSVQGDAIAAPYFDGHITDPVKIATASQAYRDVMAGAMPGDQMPDLRDVLLTEAYPYLSYAPAPGLDARGILTHMCGHCHNSTLDQTISRSNFNVDDLDALPAAVKAEAIARLQKPDDDIEKMPPTRFHTLSDEELLLVIGELSQ